MVGNPPIKSIPKAALARLPKYLEYLKEKRRYGTKTVSAAEFSAAFAESSNDLDSIGALGGKSEYDVNSLIEFLNSLLSRENPGDAVLVGAGQLGRTLLAYDGFSEYGLNIVAAFDISPAVIGERVKGKQVFSVEKMKDLCERLHIRIGIITVPARSAQQTADLLVKCGIKAVWNFSQTTLKLPEDIIVQDENMAASLASLSNKLKSRINSGG